MRFITPIKRIGAENAQTELAASLFSWIFQLPHPFIHVFAAT